MKCPLFRSGLGARYLPGGRHEWLPEGRRGADDEDPRSNFASDGEEDYVVAGSGDHRDHRPADAALELAESRGRVWRIVGQAGGATQAQARAAGGGRARVRPVPGEVFRFQRAAFSREAATGTSDAPELHVGEEGVARSGPGACATPARGASASAGTTPVARDAAAHRWEAAPVVSG